jgi:hypothetical protein
MKTKRFFLFGLPAVLLALGLVLAGCDDGSDDDSDSGGPASLSDFAGTYTGGFTTPTETTLTVTENSLAAGSVTISSVTTSEGGTGSSGVTWVYLNAGGNKIGIACDMGGGVKTVYLGTAIVAAVSGLSPTPSGISNGAIIGMGTK